MSLTIYSLLVVILGRIIGWAGYSTPSEAEIANFLSVSMQIIGAIGIYIGRVRIGDITWYGKRITETTPLR